MKRLYIQTYGCQMNQYDSERIARVLERVDYVPTESIENADLILLNTAPPLLRFEVARGGEVLFARQPHDWTDFKARSIPWPSARRTGR